MSVLKFLWVSVSVCYCLWVSVSVHECPWVSVSICECPWLSVSVREYPWVSVFIFRVCRTICLLCSDSLYRYVWMKHGVWRWVDLCSSGLSACCCTPAQSNIGTPYVLLTHIHWQTYILLSDRETDPYIHIMSNSSRNSSLSFIEIFQNRKQFQGINSIQNPRCVMITYYFLFYIQYSAWVLI